jgi:Domain of unknown function (DUF4145)
MAVFCELCKGFMVAETRGRSGEPSGNDLYEADLVSEDVAMQCETCRRFIVLRRWWSEELDYDEEGRPCGTISPGSFLQVWPIVEDRPDYVTPRVIWQAIVEARRCLQVSAYLAASLMARRAIEMTATDHGFKTGTLETKVSRMVMASKLSNQLGDWADTVRLVGNAAAHDTDPLARADAEDVVELADAIVAYVYTFGSRYTAHKDRRDKRDKLAAELARRRAEAPDDF